MIITVEDTLVVFDKNLTAMNIVSCAIEQIGKMDDLLNTNRVESDVSCVL